MSADNDIVEAEIHEPTVEEELAEALATIEELSLDVRRAERLLNDIDGEARAYDKCVKALEALELRQGRSSGQSFNTMSVGGGGSSPVVRVLEAVAARFRYTLSADQLREVLTARQISGREREELEAFRREFGQLRQASQRVEEAAYPPHYNYR